MGEVHGVHCGLTTAGFLSLLAREPDLSAALPLRIVPHNAQLTDVDLAVCSARELELHDFHGSVVNSVFPLPHSCSSPSPTAILTLQHSSALMSLLFYSKRLNWLLHIAFKSMFFTYWKCVHVLTHNLFYIWSVWVRVLLLCRFVHVGACVAYIKKQEVSRKTESELPFQFPCQLSPASSCLVLEFRYFRLKKTRCDSGRQTSPMVW